LRGRDLRKRMGGLMGYKYRIPEESREENGRETN
jgi:hypothetical protein